MERKQPAGVLLVRVPSALCALPLSEVIENMRPLPVSPLSELPDFVLGVAVIRGTPTPVIELEALFQANAHAPARRFVTVRSGGRTVALAVDEVVGVSAVDRFELANLSPLLQNTRTDAISAMGRLDAELVAMLEVAKVVPGSIWNFLDSVEAAP